MPLGRLLTTKSQFRTLCNHLKINLCERGKFYCDINYFIYEITSRLLRDKIFYLRVEFSYKRGDDYCEPNINLPCYIAVTYN